MQSEWPLKLFNFNLLFIKLFFVRKKEYNRNGLAESDLKRLFWISLDFIIIINSFKTKFPIM